MTLRSRLERAEKKAPDPAARPQLWVRTHRDHPCHLHTEPGPEMWEDEDGTDHPVTDAMREQWEREGVFVVCTEYVGTCHTNGCEPGV